jgi:hypothetical protein
VANSGESSATDPLRQLLDLFVYAPIGMLSVAQKELPNLIETGKTRFDNQITVARFIGKMAVQQGRKELQRRLDDAERSRRGPGVVVDDAHIPPVATPLTASLPEIVLELVAESPLLDDAAVVAAELPIGGYDSLAASQVVLRLGSLTPDELTSIERYEITHRNRRTILGKINQLQAR